MVLALVSCNCNRTVAGAAGGWLGDSLPGVSGRLHVENCGPPHSRAASGQWPCLYLRTSKASFQYWWELHGLLSTFYGLLSVKTGIPNFKRRRQRPTFWWKRCQGYTVTRAPGMEEISKASLEQALSQHLALHICLSVYFLPLAQVLSLS